MLKLLTKVALWLLSILVKPEPEQASIPVVEAPFVTDQDPEVQAQGIRGLTGEDILQLQEEFRIPEYLPGDSIDKWIAASAQQAVIRYLNNNYRIQ